VSLLVSLLTIFSMVKIWAEAFWKKAPIQTQPNTRNLGFMVAPAVGLAVVTVTIGLATQPFYELALGAANQLADPSAYVAAVHNASLALR
jgi:hypothetical protein